MHMWACCRNEKVIVAEKLRSLLVINMSMTRVVAITVDDCFC